MNLTVFVWRCRRGTPPPLPGGQHRGALRGGEDVPPLPRRSPGGPAPRRHLTAQVLEPSSSRPLTVSGLAHSTVQYNTARYCTVKYSTSQNSTVLYIRHSASFSQYLHLYNTRREFKASTVKLVKKIFWNVRFHFALGDSLTRVRQSFLLTSPNEA